MLAVEKFIKLKEAADLLGVSLRTLYRMMAAGEFPKPLPDQRRSLVPLSAVVAYQNKVMRGVSQ